MYNRELGDHTFPQEKGIATGQSVTQEGQLLSAILESGHEVVKPCAAAGSEVVVGFSSSTRLLVDKECFAMHITVPSAGPYTVDLGKQNIIAGQARIAGLTLGSAANPGEFEVSTLGIATFNAAQAGISYDIFAKHSLTVEESRMLYREGFLHNARAFEVYDKIGVIEGKGVIYTDQFDISKDYSAGGLKTGAGGQITVGGAGTALPSHVRVISLPSLSNPFLGLEFNF
jgi:hypothetical protein